MDGENTSLAHSLQLRQSLPSARALPTVLNASEPRQQSASRPLPNSTSTLRALLLASLDAMLVMEPLPTNASKFQPDSTLTRLMAQPPLLPAQLDVEPAQFLELTLLALLAQMI